MNKNIIKIKRRIKELEHALHEFNILVSGYADPDDVPCAIDMEICHIEQELCKEYAKLGVSMTDLSDDEKEKWK
jgi:hypothetical protein